MGQGRRATSQRVGEQVRAATGAAAGSRRSRRARHRRAGAPSAASPPMPSASTWCITTDDRAAVPGEPGDDDGGPRRVVERKAGTDDAGRDVEQCGLVARSRAAGHGHMTVHVEARRRRPTPDDRTAVACARACDEAGAPRGPARRAPGGPHPDRAGARSPAAHRPARATDRGRPRARAGRRSSPGRSAPAHRQNARGAWSPRVGGVRGEPTDPDELVSSTCRPPFVCGSPFVSGGPAPTRVTRAVAVPAGPASPAHHRSLVPGPASRRRAQSNVTRHGRTRCGHKWVTGWSSRDARSTTAVGRDRSSR